MAMTELPHSRRAVAAGAPLGAGEGVYYCELYRYEVGEDELGDAVAVVDAVGVPRAEQVHGHEQLAPIVGVDRAEGDAHAPRAQPGPGTNLDVDAERRLDRDAGGHRGRVAGEVDVAGCRQAGIEVEAAGMRCGPPREHRLRPHPHQL